jgi:hypothetical protein
VHPCPIGQPPSLPKVQEAQLCPQAWQSVVSSAGSSQTPWQQNPGYGALLWRPQGAFSCDWLQGRAATHVARLPSQYPPSPHDRPQARQLLVLAATMQEAPQQLPWPWGAPVRAQA